MIDNVDWVKCLENLSVQEMYDLFLYRLNQACNSHIPKIKISSDTRKKNPYFSEEVRVLVRIKQNLRYEHLASKWKNIEKVKLVFRNFIRSADLSEVRSDPIRSEKFSKIG